MEPHTGLHDRHPRATLLPTHAESPSGESKLHDHHHHLHHHVHKETFTGHMAWTWRRFLKHSISTPMVVCLCCLFFFSGFLLNTSDSLPVPDGPQVAVVSRTGRNLQAESKAAATISVGARPEPTNWKDMEKHLIDQSGILSVRPNLPPASSGNKEYTLIPHQVISWYPRITYFPAFISKEQAEHIKEIAKKQMYPSGLAYRPGESIDETQQVRTSTGTFLTSNQDPQGILSWVEERVAAVTHLPVENGEAWNVLHYQNGQHYDSHYDSFDPKEYGQQPSQRIATFLMYLADVEEGGETIFKREGYDNGDKEIKDWRKCNGTEGGLMVKPRLGDAVLFWSVDPHLELDRHALHGACPVVKGEKWSAAKWIRDKPLRPPLRK